MPLAPDLVTGMIASYTCGYRLLHNRVAAEKSRVIAQQLVRRLFRRGRRNSHAVPKTNNALLHLHPSTSPARRHNMDIPGFYWDEERRRYFRIPPGTTCGPGDHVRKKAKAKEARVEAAKSNEQSLSKVNTSKALFHHEAKVSPSQTLNLQECVMQSRLREMKVEKPIAVPLQDYRGDAMTDIKCQYIVGQPSRDAVYGVWQGANGTAVGRVDLTDAIQSKPDKQSFVLISSLPPRNYIVDFSVCSSDTSEVDSVLCLGKHINRPVFIEHSPHSPKEYSSLSISFTRYDADVIGNCIGVGHSVRFELPRVLYSCAAKKSAFAVGGEKFVQTFTQSSNGHGTPYGGFCDEKQIEIDSTATALKFTSKGSFLVVGTNTGRAMVFDPRYKRQQVLKTPGGKSVVYIHTMEDENEFIVSGHDNLLNYYDMRHLSLPVATFDGHVNSCSRVPVNVDESLKLVCAPGDDGTVRFWSLSSGRMLNAVPFPIENTSSVDVQPQFCCFSYNWKSARNVDPLLITCVADKLYVYRRDADS